LFEVADFFEFEFGMEGNAGGLIGIDGRDDDAESGLASADDQVIEEE